ncbi:MAG TPA: hypothetical protein VL359_03475, partial [bacterium]|nr:hypothetical protein [bacterium]
MAVPSTLEPLQVINEGLGVERQKLLRERMAEYFAAFSKKAGHKRELQYILNRENYNLDQVLRLNDGADALFTAFQYDVRMHKSDAGEQLVGDGAELPAVAPHLRYTLITDLQRLCDQGAFRYRKLILVGDIYTKIGQFLRSSLPVQLTFFTDDARTQVSDLLTIQSAQRIAPADLDPGHPPSQAGDGPIPVSRINSLRIADIPFDGIVNMPERGNRYLLPDASLLDTCRKLFVMRGSKEGLSQERQEAERRTFLHTKRVLVVLEPELEHVVSDRLRFDGMQSLWRAHSLDEARTLLANGRSQGFVEFFEANGYDVLTEACSQEQRDRLLVALLGERLGEQLQRELKAARGNLSALEAADVDALLGGLPAPLVDQALEGLQRKSSDRVLALIPVKIRDAVILEHLRGAENARGAWRAIGEEERKEAQQALQPLLLAHLYLQDTPQFQRRLGAVKLDFAEPVNSASYAALPPAEQADVFGQVARAVAKARPPATVLAHAYPPAELERLMEGLLQAHAQEAYNRLNPVVRKQLWLTVGQQARERIFQGLPLQDKLEV